MAHILFVRRKAVLTPYQQQLTQRFYRQDPREMPIYSIAEVSRYIRVHENTLRSWIYGRPYLRRGVLVASKPLIRLPDRNRPLLSFYNFAEAFNLSSLTRIDNIQFKKIRAALETVEEKFGSPHPLIDQEFWTEGIDLYIKETEHIYNLSRGGQGVFKEIVETYLKRIVRDKLDLSPIKVYPFSREIKFDILTSQPDKQRLLEEAPKHIEVDPLVAFGRPTLTGTGVPVETVASRKRAGDSVGFIADDYGISEEQVQEAIEYDRRPKKVA